MKIRSANPANQEHPIAVVEEVADNIYSVKFILQSLGYTVSSIRADHEFLSALREFNPALIIVDMLIPGRGGFDVIRTLRKSDFSSTPVVAITADAMEGEEKEARECGADEILSKPYSVPELQQVLGKHLR